MFRGQNKCSGLCGGGQASRFCFDVLFKLACKWSTFESYRKMREIGNITGSVWNTGTTTKAYKLYNQIIEHVWDQDSSSHNGHK